MKKLREYLRANKIGVEAFADMANVTRQTIYNIIWRKVVPYATTQQKITKATQGHITQKDWQRYGKGVRETNLQSNADCR